MTKAVRGSRLGGRRSVLDCTTPQWVLDELTEARKAGYLEPFLMARHFGNPGIGYAIKAAAEKRHAQEAADKAVAERIVSGGRKPSYAPSLSNKLPEGNNKPHPVPGVYETWTCGLPDGPMARALADAGYMPISEYVRLYSSDDGA